MVYQSNEFLYYEGNKIQAINLPCSNEKLDMTIILHKIDIKLDSVIDNPITDSQISFLNSIEQKKHSILCPEN